MTGFAKKWPESHDHRDSRLVFLSDGGCPGFGKLGPIVLGADCPPCVGNCLTVKTITKSRIVYFKSPRIKNKNVEAYLSLL